MRKRIQGRVGSSLACSHDIHAWPLGRKTSLLADADGGPNGGYDDAVAAMGGWPGTGCNSVRKLLRQVVEPWARHGRRHGSGCAGGEIRSAERMNPPPCEDRDKASGRGVAAVPIGCGACERSTVGKRLLRNLGRYDEFGAVVNSTVRDAQGCARLGIKPLAI